MPRSSLSLAHTNGPPCDAWYISFHLGKNSVRPTFHLLQISYIRNSVQPTFHLLRISHIRNFVCRRSTFPDISHPEFCPTDIQPSSDISHPEFCPIDVQPSLDISHSEFCPADVPPSPDISHPTPTAGWERRAIQLPRSSMSGSSNSAYPESIRSRQFRFPEQLGSSDTHDPPDPFPPTIKRQTPIILTTKSPEMSLIFNAR